MGPETDTMWNWAFGGLLAMIGYVFKLLSELRKEKLSKSQFEEYRKTNDNDHQNMKEGQTRLEAASISQDTKLDQILFNQAKGGQ